MLPCSWRLRWLVRSVVYKSPAHQDLMGSQSRSSRKSWQKSWPTFSIIGWPLGICRGSSGPPELFIPKSPDASTAGELRPITISSLLVRTFSWLLLMRLQEDHSFHPLQSGFSNDRAAQSNLLILQGLMKDAQKNHRPFFAASLDLRKAFDSVSHCALLASLEEGGRMGTTWPQSETCTPSKQLLFPIEGRRTAGEFTCRGE